MHEQRIADAPMVGRSRGASLATLRAPPSAQALRPNILITLDTSGSMLYSQSTTARRSARQREQRTARPAASTT